MLGNYEYFSAAAQGSFECFSERPFSVQKSNTNMICESDYQLDSTVGFAD